MITSVYLRQYYGWLTGFFKDHGVVATPTSSMPTTTVAGTVPYTPAQLVLYVPGSSIQAMCEYLVRKNILTKTTDVSTPFLYFGYSRGPINKMPEARRHKAVSSDSLINTYGSFRDFQNVSIPLSTFVVSNRPELIEDLEEVYAIYMRHVSNVYIDVSINSPVYIQELDAPGFAVATFHEDVNFSGWVDVKGYGNLYGASFSQKLLGRVISLSNDTKLKATALDINIYENIIDPDHLRQTIHFPIP